MTDMQLLILGNGFDLQCGLKSTFNDFEETRLAELTNMGKSLSARNQLPCTSTPGPDGYPVNGNKSEDWFWNKEYTLWDFILKKEQQADTWYDIESCIKQWVINIKDKMEEGVIDRSNRGMQKSSNLGSPKTPFFWDQDIREAIKAYATTVYKWDGKIEKLLQILLSELHRYEDAFASYLRQQTKENPSYTENALNLIKKLTNNQFSPAARRPKLNPYTDKLTLNPYTDKLWQPEISILNFNYTTPLPSITANSFASNVHGEASKGNIIFGIDGTGVNTYLPLYREIVKFTKTYRLMELSSDPHPSVVQPALASGGLIDTGYIKFFGHSLGEADYSYFQAIFDEVDLYESRVHLIFYYNTNRRNDTNGSGKNAAEEMFEKVNHLINRYGETLDNKDHGKNLLHKLLLEGRLSVIQAPL